ncbi:MAG TPA: beta-ketoacyl-ACP synthase III [Stellaceae bacterium]|nr:beta-ketoacyl-ACP synthase III [Stellaceae bacterium]
MALRSIVRGCGAYLPARIVTNDELATRVETSDEWIRQRTGITQRHLAADGELTSDLAVAAATRALDHAGLRGVDIDLIVLATSTPDETFPATATRVQHRLGMTGGAAFDVQAVCSGFVYALATADNFIKAGQARNVLVIGAETFSRILDWTDRQTCVLFGDGAGAVVLSAEQGSSSPGGSSPGGSGTDRGVLSTHLHSDGSQHDILYVDGGPSSTRTTGYLRMEGKEVFRHAVHRLAQVVDEALSAHHLTPRDIDWLVPHQANKRIIDGVGRKLALPPEKVVLTVDRHANTSAASIPLALSEAVHDGRIKQGDLVLLEAMGGGLTWGAALVRW